MNKISFSIRAFVLSVTVLFFAASGYASQSDYYLKIEGKKTGKTYTSKLSRKNGSFTSADFKFTEVTPDVYRVTIVDNNGKPVSITAGKSSSSVLGKFTVSAPRDAASGQASGRSAVQSPRDVATGQASGKRQHKPFSASGNITANGIADLDCDGLLDSVLEGRLEVTGQITSMDSWSSQR